MLGSFNTGKLLRSLERASPYLKRKRRPDPGGQEDDKLARIRLVRGRGRRKAKRGLDPWLLVPLLAMALFLVWLLLPR